MDWLNDKRAEELDKGRKPDPVGSPRAGITTTLVLVAGLAVLALLVWLSTRPQTPEAEQEAPGATVTNVEAPAEESPSAAPTRSAAQTPEATSDLTGAPLAHAWLRAYFTRPGGGADTSWSDAITPYSDPELVTTLSGAEDLGAVGKWGSIAVKSIKADTREHAPSTPTRQISGWIVEVTDGKTTTQLPYLITAYVDDAGRWSVAQAEQGYTSEA